MRKDRGKTIATLALGAVLVVPGARVAAQGQPPVAEDDTEKTTAKAPSPLVPVAEKASLSLYQGAPPLVPVGVRKRPIFLIGGWRGELQLGFQWDKQDVSRSQGSSSSFSRVHFDERLRVRTRGMVWDPRLLTFRLGATFGMFQESFDSVGQSGNAEGELVGYDTSATFLGGKPYSLDLSASRTKDVQSQQFAGTKDITAQTLGVRLHLDDPRLRSVLGYLSEQFDEVQRFGPDVFRRAENRSELSYSGTRLGEVSELSLDYRFQDVEDEVVTSLSFNAHDGAIGYRLFFGPYLEKDLRTRLRYFSRQGRFDLSTGRADVNLRMDHTDSFASLYDYTYLETDQDGSATITQLAKVGIQHQLYSSLTSSLQATANETDGDFGTIRGYEGVGGLRYKKRIPRNGRLQVGIRNSYRVDQQESPAGQLFVFGEVRLVSGFALIFLDNSFVVPGTIRVTDQAGTTIFNEGVDYRIVQVGDATALERLPGGLFQDNQTLLVDYRFLTSNAFEFTTRRFDVDLALDYDWLLIFVKRFETKQDLVEGDDDRFLNDMKDFNTGIRLKWAQPARSMTLAAEYRDFRSDRLSYTSPIFRQSFSMHPKRRLFFTADLSQSFFQFTDPDRDTTTLLGRLSIRWQPTRYLKTEYYAAYLQRDDSLAPEEQHIDAGVRLRLDFAKLEIVPNFRVSRRMVGDRESTAFHFDLKIVRRLF